MAQEFVTVATTDEVAEGKPKLVSSGGKDIAVFRIGEEYFAIGNECPHYGADLCDGYVRDKTVTCPWHGWEFDLENGASLTRPGYDVESFEIKIEDGQVKIAIGK